MVYVDPNFDWPKSRAWPFGSVSHMYADNEKELHDFAAKIGLKRMWASDITQPNSFLLHYDLSPGMRAKAVKAGAIEVNHQHKQKYEAVGHPLFNQFRDCYLRYIGEPLVRHIPFEEWETLWRIFLAGGYALNQYKKDKKE